MFNYKTVKDRLYLLNNIDKIIFNSKWSQKRFFVNIENENLLKQKTAVCYQSTSKPRLILIKKDYFFIGKLNSAKGYDLFGKSILRIFNKYHDWSAVFVMNLEKILPSAIRI